MKKICFTALLFYFFIAKLVFAQNFDFSRAYQDYLYTYNQYRESHNEYIVAKNQYLNYQTLTAKNKALIATRKMLEVRSEVLRTYLTALRLRLAETTSVVGYQANTLYLKIDNEVNWLVKHKDSLSSASTLEDLLEISGEFEKRYPKTEVLIYQTLGEIIKSKEVNLYEKTRKVISATEEKILEIKRSDSEKALLWERWLLEAKNKALRGLEKQGDSKKILQKKDFLQFQFSLKESNQYLKEVVFYLKEIIQKIKYD